jgi:hypothetical protein
MMEYCEDCNITYDGEPSNYCHECGKRLAPGGSPPETGSPDRVAGRQPGDPHFCSSELPFAGQAKAQIERWKRESAALRNLAEELYEEMDSEEGNRTEGLADGLARAAEELEEIVACYRAVAQSDRSEGETCRCGNPVVHYTFNGVCYCGGCHNPWARGAGMERSGPANAEVCHGANNQKGNDNE